jgi:hypothetical protein
MAIDVMNGGTLAVGSTSVTFTNNTGKTVYVNGCTLSGFPAKVPVPNGGGTVIFSPPGPPAATGSYPYTTSLSKPREINPVIKVQ